MSINIYKIENVGYEDLKKPKVSVVLPTFRKNPKFELLYKCLSQQTVKPFEFVIADCLYEMHKDYVETLAKKYNLQTVHAPRDTLDNIHGLNTGIANSGGDYLFFINDCTYYPHRWVEKHLLVCGHEYLSLGSRYFAYSMDFPIEDYLTGQIEIPSVQDEEISKKINEASHGIKDYLHINFGEHKVISPQDFRLLGMPSEVLTSDNLVIEALPGWSYGGNIAALTEMVLEINGFDEEYDKGYGWADCDFGVRIFNKKCRSFINPSNWCLEIQDKDHESVYNVQPEINNKKSADHNWKLYSEACEQGKTWVNPNMDLRKLRVKCSIPSTDEFIDVDFDKVVKVFHHRMYWSGPPRAWFGTNIGKMPYDLFNYQEIIYETQPDTIIETGTMSGGATLFFAHMLDLIGKKNGLVITIDRTYEDIPFHPKIYRIRGSSTDEDVVEDVKQHMIGNVMVNLDSDHHKDYVLEEMKIYNKFVTAGYYMIVEDGDINGHPVYPEFGPGPYEAIEEFLKIDNHFEIDKSREKWYITNCPNGYLRKISD